MNKRDKESIRVFAKGLEGDNLVNFMHDVLEQDIEDEDDGSGNGRTYEELINVITDFVVQRVENEEEKLTSILACMYNYSIGDRSRMSREEWKRQTKGTYAYKNKR